MQAKRKLAALLLSLCMVLGMLPMTVFAAGGTTTSGLTYEINGESVTITGYTGNEASVVIPNEIEGKPVTAIGERAFYQNKTLTSVAIPDSVTGIGKSAFYKSGLENINIPAGVTTIGMYAFANCESLSSATFADGSALSSIGSDVFASSGLENIEIPAEVTSIGEFAFNNCESLSSVTFAEGSRLSSIGDFAFSLTYSLTSIEIPDGVTVIGDFAFLESGLENINIPAGVTTIEMSAFWECYKLESITFEGRTAPELGGDGVFDGCTALTAIHVRWRQMTYSASAPPSPPFMCLAELTATRRQTAGLRIRCKRASTAWLVISGYPQPAPPTEPSSTGGALCAAATS